MSYVDGNAIAGALSIAFGTDMSQARGICASCGEDHPLAEGHVYLRNPGMVLRCPGCSAVTLVMVEIRHRLQLTVNGLSSVMFGAVPQPA